MCKPVVQVERFSRLLALGFAMESHGSHPVRRPAVEPAVLALHRRLDLCQKLAADAASPPGLLGNPDTVDDGHTDAGSVAVRMTLDHADRVGAVVGDPGKRSQLGKTVADPLSLGLGRPFPERIGLRAFSCTDRGEVTCGAYCYRKNPCCAHDSLTIG